MFGVHALAPSPQLALRVVIPMQVHGFAVRLAIPFQVGTTHRSIGGDTGPRRPKEIAHAPRLRLVTNYISITHCCSHNTSLSNDHLDSENCHFRAYVSKKSPVARISINPIPVPLSPH